MKNRAIIVIVTAISVFVSACATSGPNQNTTNGAIVGSLLGAIVGAAVTHNRAQGAVIGAIGGGLLGAGVGSYLDAREKARLRAASLQAASGTTGQRYNWTAQTPSPNGGAPSQITASGWVTPVDSPYTANNGETCRDLQQVAVKNGTTHQQNVQACQSSSGWVVPSA